MIQAALKVDRTLAHWTQQIHVHRNRIRDWKKQHLDSAEGLSENGFKTIEVSEVQVMEPDAKIGELRMEWGFFPTALDRDRRANERAWWIDQVPWFTDGAARQLVCIARS